MTCELKCFNLFIVAGNKKIKILEYFTVIVQVELIPYSQKLDFSKMQVAGIHLYFPGKCTTSGCNDYFQIIFDPAIIINIPKK